MHLPKLRIHWHPHGSDEDVICTLKDAEVLIFSQGMDILVYVEGEMVASYKDLVRLVHEPKNRGKKVLEVRLISVVAGG